MIDIDYSDIEKLEAHLSDLARRFSDLTPFWNDFAVDLLPTKVREVFRTEGYGTWPALDPAYARAKAAAYPGKGILRRTDAYFQASSEVSHPGNVFLATPTELVFGVGGSYFEAVAGENYPERREEGRGVDARPVYGLLAESADFDAEISKLLDTWSADEISESDQDIFR